MKLPPFMFPHTVSLEAYAGSAAYQPLYSAAVSVHCLMANDVGLVRDPQSGEETVSTGTLYCQPGITAPPDSRVTLSDGSTRTVIRTGSYDPGSLPVPGSTVLYLK